MNAALKGLRAQVVVATVCLVLGIGIGVFVARRHSCRGRLEGHADVELQMKGKAKCPKCFRTITSLCSDGDIIRCLDAYFEEGAPAELYENIWRLADKVEKKGSTTTYTFWFRGEKPGDEGDYWYKVTVNNDSATITSAGW